MLFQTLTSLTLLALTSAAPTSLSKRWPEIPNILRPTVISSYSTTNGAITYDVPKGTAAKTSSGEISTLVTFSNPSQTLPTDCRVRFYLDGADAGVVTEGTKQINIFTSFKGAPEGGSTGWGGPGNQRNGDVGRFLVYKGGNADLLWGNEVVKCPAKGETVAFEVVPAGEVDRVEWSKGLSGLYLTWV
ncbi:hypothetical protein CC86DRAFT_420695 [Ophiobolus disseminans]|uniref:Ubiquitin 3 binding protein But2 C-terminal domain-containing protein n=1 Tax=Ophiobolus disseminans TaxID=1469910 RepID=A0A6A6ZTS2_9PLEO|nr:hypothetical protein CC86DRAFT_420695 [Ophiobolus disseminans]